MQPIGCKIYQQLMNEYDGAITFSNGVCTPLYYHIIYCDSCEEIQYREQEKETLMVRTK